MVESSLIPKQTLAGFLGSLNISCISSEITLNAVVDIMVPGRRKFFSCKVTCFFHSNHVIVKLLKEDLYPVFPSKFDSRSDIFTVCNDNCFCLEGYSITGKYRAHILPVTNPFEVYSIEI